MSGLLPLFRRWREWRVRRWREWREHTAALDKVLPCARLCPPAGK